jgi:hypothetical protein
MRLTEGEANFIYNFLLQEEEEIKDTRFLPRELEDQFRAELSSAFTASKMKPMVSKHGSVFLASLNPQYGAAKGQGRYRVSQLAHNTPEFWSSLTDKERKTFEGHKDSPMIPLFHASFHFPDDVVKTVKDISTMPKDLHPTNATVALWKHDRSDTYNLDDDSTTRLGEVVEGFLNDLQESFKQEFVEPFGPLMSFKKIRKVSAVMAGATGAGVP